MKKSQGEIFGIALMFVVIIFGIIIYAKVVALNPDSQKDLVKESKYKILAEGTLNTILKQSTGCYAERNKDSLIDLINYCLYNHNGEFARVDISCDTGIQDACTYPIKILNDSLINLYNNSNNYMIPFYLTIYLDDYSKTSLSNVNITNFGDIKYKENLIMKDNYRKLGFSKAPSGLISVPTSYRNIDFELALYYR